jgi:hypothetical protein
MLHRVLDKAEHLEVVQEILRHEELGTAIERFDPEWVILSSPSNQDAHNWVDTCMANYPSVRFIFLSPDQRGIRMKWQSSYEEDLTNLSLSDFIHVLEKDLQQT